MKLSEEERKDQKRRHERAYRNARKKLNKKSEYDGPLYEIEYPSQEDILAACLKMQETWTDEDYRQHRDREDCTHHEVPIMSHCHMQEENAKKDEAVLNSVCWFFKYYKGD